MKSTKPKIGSLKYQKIDQHLAQVNKEKKEKNDTFGEILKFVMLT